MVMITVKDNMLGNLSVTAAMSVLMINGLSSIK